MFVRTYQIIKNFIGRLSPSSLYIFHLHVWELSVSKNRRTEQRICAQNLRENSIKWPLILYLLQVPPFTMFNVHLSIKMERNEIAKCYCLMQPSVDILNSPSSRIVKDSTPSRRQILRCINFGIGESSPNLFLNMLNFYLVRFEAR